MERSLFFRELWLRHLPTPRKLGMADVHSGTTSEVLHVNVSVLSALDMCTHPSTTIMMVIRVGSIDRERAQIVLSHGPLLEERRHQAE